MNILVVTSFRSWEVLDPLAETDATVWSVKVDPTERKASRFLAVLKECREVMLKYNIDVLLLDVFEIPGLAALLLAEFEEMPIVVRLVGDLLGDVTDDHLKRAKEMGNIVEWITYNLIRRLNRPIITHADGIIVVSTDLREKLCAQTSFDKRKVRVVPVPFRPSRFQIKEDNTYRFHPDEEIILTVTSLNFRGKFIGVKQSISAIKTVLQQREHVYYLVAGGGRYVKSLREYVDETLPDEIRNRVIITGFVEDISSLYTLADIMVYISYIDGYPNAVLEAQGLGVPVIANADFGMIDQIEDMETGILVDDDDHLLNPITYLLNHPDERVRIGNNAQEVVRKRNSLERIGNDYVNYLSILLNLPDE